MQNGDVDHVMHHGIYGHDSATEKDGSTVTLATISKAPNRKQLAIKGPQANKDLVRVNNCLADAASVGNSKRESTGFNRNRVGNS